MAECRVLSEASWKEPAKRQNTVFYVDLEEWEAVPGMRWHGRAPIKMGAEGRKRRRLTGVGVGVGSRKAGQEGCSHRAKMQWFSESL